MNMDSSVCASSGHAPHWEQLDWNQCQRQVRRLQARIVKATRAGRWGKVKTLQWLLTHSFAAKALAVKRVTENQGKKTPGVDRVLWRTPAAKLKARGIPESEIAFIQDHDSDASKLALFKEVRAGQVRVLFGSTQKMGSGTNAQERLIALHHLDAPWRPADVEQREGRILRQGNKNPVVSVFRYVTEGSFDAYMWQTLETKAKFIAQVMTGDMTIRRVEDLDSAALTYAEVKAIASGNPLVIEKAQVDAELMRLTRLRSAHTEEQYRIRSNLRHARDEAGTCTERLTNLRLDIGAREDTFGDNFRIELDGELVTNRGVAGELLIRLAEKLKGRRGDDVRVGKIAGFDLFIRVGFIGDPDLVVRGKNSYAAKITDTALGTIRSLESTVQGFEERAGKLESAIGDAQKRATELEGRVGAPFDREERYQELTRRQSEIEEKLDLTKNQAPSVADARTDENESSVDIGRHPEERRQQMKKSYRGIRVCPPRAGQRLDISQTRSSRL